LLLSLKNTKRRRKIAGIRSENKIKKIRSHPARKTNKRIKSNK
jgi:hypothetical protein